MKLKTCPACKNLVGTEGWCCPRCGVDWRARRFRRVMMLLIVLGIGAWLAWGRFGQ